jgi:DNA-binding transcriptional LysR family regulator
VDAVLSHVAVRAQIRYNRSMTDRKRTGQLDWEDVRYFLALSRSGTLSGAARVLHVNHATVARRTKALEATLGKVLFTRRVDGYGLTPSGEAALEIATAMECSALALPESLEKTALQGPVRLTTVGSLANHILAGGLAAFAREHPGIVLEILADIRVMSLARREADIALRLGRPKDSSLIGRHLASVHYGFYSAFDMAPDCVRAPFIAYDMDADNIVEAAWLIKRLGSRAISFRSNSIEAQAAAARAGLGIVLLPRFMGSTDKALVEVHPMEPHPPRELWLLTPRELAWAPRVRAVMEAITGIVTQNRKIIEDEASSHVWPTSMESPG